MEATDSDLKEAVLFGLQVAMSVGIGQRQWGRLR
jgi:hypothetical protein